MEKHKWFWVMLFIFAVVLLTGLATSWNVAFVRNPKFKDIPWGILVLGTLGFIAVVVSTVMFFVRLLMEMRLNQMQSEFLAKISHELKSPITSLELTASMIHTGVQTGQSNATEQEELWRIFNSELKRLKTEVNLILETSRWEATTYKPQLTRINLNDWLNHATHRWSAILGQGATLEIINNIDKGNAMVDTQLLDLISDNLVDNARKFSVEKPHLTITAKTSIETNGKHIWLITFTDLGWGFDPKNTGKIFKRFYRAETNAPRAIAGTGLGLYLARQAGKKFDVHLSAQSKGIGKGASFTMQGDLV